MGAGPHECSTARMETCMGWVVTLYEWFFGRAPYENATVGAAPGDLSGERQDVCLPLIGDKTVQD